jgi:hypothetical protein
VERHRRAEDEAAGLHADHDVDVLVLEGLGHELDGLAERGGVPKERRDVVEQDARLGEVGDLADLGA